MHVRTKRNVVSQVYEWYDHLPVVLYNISVHRKHDMQGRMHTFRYRVALSSIGRDFSFSCNKK